MTNVIKVFRLQRKTLLLFFGFFFPIIKVFRLTTEDLIVIVLFLFIIIIIIFFPIFCDRDYSKMVQYILMKFDMLIGLYMKFI